MASYTNLRAMAKIASGQLPGPEMSIAKLSLTMNMRRMTDLLSSVLGPKLIADSGEWGTYAWSQFLLGLPGMRIAGGTDEVLHNIIGERVLGLPKEPPPPLIGLVQLAPDTSATAVGPQHRPPLPRRRAPRAARSAGAPADGPTAAMAARCSAAA